MKKINLLPTCTLCIIILTGCLNEKNQRNDMANITPPKAKKIVHQDTVHGKILTDNYFWLRDETRKNEEVLNYLKAENDYTKQLTAHTKDLQQKLYDEMVGRINENDLSVPVKDGNYYYYSRTEKGKNYSINCRKVGSLEGEEVVLLDQNELAEGKKYFRVGSFEVSPNQQLLAYGIDDDGSEYYDFYFKDLKTGEILSDKLPKTGGSLEWANDNKTVFYVMLDDAHRPYQLYRYEIGSGKAAELIYQEDDDRYFLNIAKAKNDRFLYLTMGSAITTEIRYLDANKPSGNFSMLAARKQGVELDITQQGDYFYMLSNDNALNFKLLRIPVKEVGQGTWEELLPHDENFYMTAIEAFQDYLVLYGRKGGFKSITVLDKEAKPLYDVEFPEPVYTFWGSNNPEYDGNRIRITYSSLITPRTVYDYDLETKEMTMKKEYEVKGGYDKKDYVTERIMATASDGTKVPMSIAYKKGLQQDGKNPCYLNAYGSYGSSREPYFSTVRLSLMDRGFVFAMAHIRGGSEMGRHWYENGKFLHKKNTFTDFIACAEHLIQTKYTSSEHLAISGGSAGGLLMGAVVNMRPELFNVVVAEVPFVDVINTMLDETIPLTAIEWEEWGNPKDKTYFDYMLSYSPYDNVETKAYPNMLITGGLNDPRVQYWEPAKWTAKLRELKTDDKTLILKTNMGAGHGGASGRYEALKEMAFEYAFVMDKLGIAEKILD